MTVGTKRRWLLMEKERLEREEMERKKAQENTEKSVDELEELCRAHNLPTDMLQLQEVPDSAPEVGVFAGVALPRGSSFGPFRGAKIAEADREQHACVLEMPVAEDKVYLAVENAAGHWLKLLRTTENSDKNSVGICVQRNFEGGQAVWCEIQEDIAVGSELLACYRDEPYVPLPNPPSPPPVSPTSLPNSDVTGVAVPNLATQLEHNVLPLVVKPEHCSTPDVHSQPPTTTTSPPRYPLIYGCLHCGIKFSSPSTLDAHMSYYCTKKPTEVATENALQPHGPHPVMLSPRAASVSPRAALLPSDVISGSLKQEPSSPHSGHGSETMSSLKREASLDSGEECGEDGAKSARLGGIFQCPYCPYNSERKVCLNRHLKQHTPAQERSRAASPTEDAPRANETYCYQCNIQFSSYKTYRGHKEFYCGMRQRTKDTVSSPTSPRSRGEGHTGSPKGSPGKASAAFDMETLLKVGAGPPVLGGGPLMPPGGGSVMLSAPVMTPGGVANVTFNMPAMLMQPMLAMQSALAAQSAALVAPPPTATESATKTSEEAPLDLSVKKEEDETSGAERQGKGDKKSSPRPHSVSSDNMSRSPKREPASPISTSQTSPRQSSSSPRMAHPANTTPDILSAAASPLFPTLAAPPIEIIPQVPPPPMVMPSNVSKCLDCNIVFYKHENYVIHKEHYCAGRRLKHTISPEARLLPQGPIENGAPSRSSSEASTPSQTRASPGHSPAMDKDTAEPLNIYYCKPCKIKFSSVDTLKAHQQYYCPAPKEHASEDHPQVSPSAASRPEEDSGDSQDGLFTCTQCGNCYPSYRHMRMHFCNPAAALQVPLLRCPYCDFITQTDQRLVDHIRAHAPTKAYKCKLCGYRGNTVRGMRMHGKTHELAGETFTDDDMMEFEEPPLIPKRLKTLYSDPLVVDYEAELLRIKNEPYKRRRSRKSFEKTEHNPPPGPAGHMCFICHQSFPDLTQMHQHMRSHLAEQSAFCCRSCDFVSTTKSGLVRHVKMMHENMREQEPHYPSNEDMESRSELLKPKEELFSKDNVIDNHKANQSSPPSPATTSPPLAAKPSSPSYTEYPKISHADYTHPGEPKVSEYTNSSESGHSRTSVSPQRDSMSVKQELRRSPVHPESSPPTHDQASPTGSPGRREDSANGPNTIECDENYDDVVVKPIVVKPETPSSQSEGTNRSENRSPANEDDENDENYVDVVVKSETSPRNLSHEEKEGRHYGSEKSGSLNHNDPPPGSPKDGGRIAVPNLVAATRPIAPLSPVNGSVAPSNGSPMAPHGLHMADRNCQRYCKQCDISFTYLSSFVAHKKHYCSSHVGEKKPTPMEISG